MSLQALAPDQRAVVQLVLQQERSYDDLAGLLGISTEAVRERARAGLERIGGSPGDLTGEELGEISDYLLGQQSVSRREATRSLLSSSRDARRWANRVSDSLVEVARSPLPGVPDEEEAAAAPEVSPVPFAPAAEPSTSPALALPEDDEDDDGPFVADPDPDGDQDEPEPEDEPVTQVREGDAETAPVRARPRPRPAGEAPRPRARPRSGAGTGTSGTPRSSKVGGALLIAGIALMLAVAVVFILTRDGDDDAERADTDAPEPTATATPTATPPAVEIELKPTAAGGEARGAVALFVNAQGQIQFNIAAENVPQSREGEAYAVWMTGGGKPKRLGFAEPVGEDGVLAVAGPPQGSEKSFPRDFTRARRFVISRETTSDATQPGQAILRGEIPRQTGG